MSDTFVRADTAGRTVSGEFQPILPGFHPDPSVCRVGSDYYLATSSFEFFPGVPIFHSVDLVSWKQIGNVLDRRSQFRRGHGGDNSGIYAPTLRHHDGRFWLAATNVSDFDRGQFVVHAEDPAGPWSDPVFFPEAIGIDPDLAWDDDGTCYLTWHDLDFVVGGKQILQALVDPSSGAMLSAPYPVWQGTGMVAAEGPHLHKHGEWWYLVLSEGGTERGHAVTVARAPHPAGPYEPAPRNPILSRRSTGHRVQNTGHADLVERTDGSWAAVYLGARVAGSTPKFHVNGRETFVSGITWEDDWPAFDVGAFDVPVPETSFVDDFSGGDLRMEWVSPSSEPPAVGSIDPRGGFAFLRGASAVLALRVADEFWSATADFEGDGGFRLRMDDRHWYGLELAEGELRAVARIGDIEHTLAVEPAPSNVQLAIAAEPAPSVGAPTSSSGPDQVVLSATLRGVRRELARLDGRYLSTEVAGGFTGRMLALAPGMRDGRVLSVRYAPRRRDEK